MQPEPVCSGNYTSPAAGACACTAAYALEFVGGDDGGGGGVVGEWDFSSFSAELAVRGAYDVDGWHELGNDGSGDDGGAEQSYREAWDSTAKWPWKQRKGRKNRMNGAFLWQPAGLSQQSQGGDSPVGPAQTTTLH